MRLKKYLTLSLALLMILSIVVVVSNAVVDSYTVEFTVERSFSNTELVFDSGIPSNNNITITYTLTPQDVPVSVVPDATAAKEIVLVVDVSGSMKRDVNGNTLYPDGNTHSSSRISIVKQALHNFVDTISTNSNVELGIIEYSSGARIEMELTDASNFNNHAQIEGVINSLIADGGTNIGDGIRKAYYMLRDDSSPASRYIVLMSDGDPTHFRSYTNDPTRYFFLRYGGRRRSSDNDGFLYAQQFAERLNTTRIPGFAGAYFIAFSNAANRLEDIANELHDFESATTASDIQGIYQDISYQLSSDVSAGSVTFTDVLPENVDIVSYPSGVTVNNRVITKNIGNIIYERDGDVYSADPITFSIVVRPTVQGDLTFNDASAGVSYINVDGTTDTESFDDDTASVLSVVHDPLTGLIASRATNSDGDYINNRVRLQWNYYTGALGYKVYKQNGDSVTLEGTLDNANNTYYEYTIEESDGNNETFLVEATLANNQRSARASTSGNTQPAVIGASVERTENQFYITWDPIPGGVYSIQPIIYDAATDTESPAGIDSTPAHFTQVGGKVQYVYTLLNPQSYTSYDDRIKFRISGTKGSATIRPRDTNNLQIKQSVISTITTTLNDVKYAKGERAEVAIKVDDLLPAGVELYDPMVLVEFILPDNTDAPLEVTYPKIFVDETTGSFTGLVFDEYRNPVRTSASVNKVFDDTIKLYIVLEDFVGSSMGAGEEIRISLDFAIGFESDETGAIDPTVFNNLRIDEYSNIELYQIERNIEGILNKFYTVRAASQPDNPVYNVDEMIQMRVSFMYNEIAKVISDPTVRDEEVASTRRYIQMRNTSNISEEF